MIHFIDKSLKVGADIETQADIVMFRIKFHVVIRVIKVEPLIGFALFNSESQVNPIEAIGNFTIPGTQIIFIFQLKNTT